MTDSNAVADFYGRWAGLYDVVASRTPGVRRLRERAIDGLGLSPGDAVVEMGCGTGANLPLLRERVGASGTVVGVDLTPGMLARARRRVERAGWRNVHLVRGDAGRPPVARADAVLATFVVGMFDEPGPTVRGWTDLLGPGDRLALLDAAPRDGGDDGDGDGGGGGGVLDAVFRLFVAASTPPTWTLRYPEPPADSLAERVDEARAGLAERCDVVVEDRFVRSFLRLTVGERR